LSITDPWATPETEPVAVESTPEIAPVHVTGSGIISPEQARVSAYVKGETVSLGASGDKITLTFKGTGTFADRWLVAHVANPSEGLTLLKDPEFKELLDLSKKIAAYDSGGASNAAPSPSPQRPGNVPHGATQPPAWAPEKPFADFVYMTGVSAKSGKTWHAWMPPEKGDGRDPKFFYPPR
jgi:hypothetical protein